MALHPPGGKAMAMDPRMQQYATYRRLVARAWDDEAFKQRLIATPAAVLKEHGVEIPAGVDVKVLEDRTEPEFGANTVVLPLPPKPSAAELSEDELDAVAAGAAGWGTPAQAPTGTLGQRDETGKAYVAPTYTVTHS
jgi:hypothetical protein